MTVEAEPSEPAANGQRSALLGSVVSSKWERGSPFDRLIVGPDRIDFVRFLRSNYRLDRDDIVGIDIDKVRIPLFWRTTFRFAQSDSGPMLMFIPYRASKLRAVLEQQGWPLA
jgi:hypothetical protein